MPQPTPDQPSPDQPSPDGGQSPRWGTAPGERRTLGFLAAVIGALSGVAQFLAGVVSGGAARDSALLFGASAAVVLAAAGAVVGYRRRAAAAAFLRRRGAALWTASLLLATVVGGAAGYLLGGAGATPGPVAAPSARPPSAAAPPDRTTPPSPAGTTGPVTESTTASTAAPGCGAVDLRAVPAGDRAARLTLQRTCRPAAGRHLWAVVQVHGVNGHSEFYPNKDLTAVGSGYAWEFALPDDADATRRRTTRVYAVDAGTARRFVAYHDRGEVIPLDELLNPPCDDCAVSPETELPLRG